MAPRPKPYVITWPFTPGHAVAIDDMFKMLFDDIRNGTLSLAVGQITGTLPATSGGTGLALFTVGDLLYASTTTTLGRLTIGANNTILRSDGSAPAWSSAPVIGSGNRLVSLNPAAAWDSSALTSAGGVIGFSRPSDGSVRGLIGGGLGSNEDGIIYWSGGGTELRFIAVGGSSAGFGFYADPAAGISVTTAFASARPTSKLVLKITGAGFTGLGGVVTPLAPLHVYTGTDQNLYIRTSGSNIIEWASIDDAGSSYKPLRISGSTILINDSAVGNVGIVQTTPTAKLHIGAGSASAGTGPLKLTAGTLMTAPEHGTLEYNNYFFYTTGFDLRIPQGGPIFDHYADVGNSTTSETDLYSDSTPANLLFLNGDKITAEYAGIFVSSATATRQLKVYFAGTMIFDSTAGTVAAGADAWNIKVSIIRESSSVIRSSVSMIASGLTIASATNYTRLTGLTFSGANILKITGQAGGVGAATNDIVAKLGTVNLYPAVS